MKPPELLKRTLPFVMLVTVVQANEAPTISKASRSGIAQGNVPAKAQALSYTPIEGDKVPTENRAATAARKYPDKFLDNLVKEIRYCEDLTVGGLAARAYVEDSTIYVSVRNLGQPLTDYEFEQALHFAVGIRIARQKLPAIFWEEWHSLLRRKYTNEPHLRGVLPGSAEFLQMDNHLLGRGYLAKVSTSSAESEFAFTFSRMMAEGWRITEQIKEYRDIWFQTVLVRKVMTGLDPRFFTNMYQPFIQEYRRLESDDIP